MENKIGRYIRSLRKNKQLTLVQLAEKTGLSQPYLSQIENGKRGVPSPEILKTLSVHLDADYFQLMAKAGYWSLEEAKMRKNIVDDINKESKERQDYFDYLDSADLSIWLNNDTIYYDGHLITENDKKLIRSYLDALFNGR